MPYLDGSTYRAPFLFRNNHLNTIYPSLYRKVKGVVFERERLRTVDDDFIDIDWSKVDSKKLVIVLHGLEGSADRPYVQGIIKIMNNAGWDGVGLNFRGCSGSPNTKARGYHSGETEDLQLVIRHATTQNQYVEIAIVGFSLGGNVTLKYVGESGDKIHPLVKKAVGISVPCHLASSSKTLEHWSNTLYMHRFLVSLKEKVREKENILNRIVDFKRAYAAKDFFEFDDAVTAPIHGFESAQDYYDRSSSLQFLPQVKIPIYLISALDDSFLSDRCYPMDLAKEHPLFYLETPSNGGHVGFMKGNSNGFLWTEQRVHRFLTSDDFAHER